MEPLFSFEEAFSKLETILEKVNNSSVSLDESLCLYEEASTLIATCNKRLSDAETKIEKLIKTREGELVMKDGQPALEPFSTGTSSDALSSFPNR